MDQEVEPIETLWQLPEVEGIVRKQQDDGSWRYPRRKSAHRSENYDLLQTYRLLRVLVEQYGLNIEHPAIIRAAEYIFAHQSAEGDIRGIFGAQYAIHYSAGLMELLIKAGYGDDIHIRKGFEWLLASRQDDGGWASPLRTTEVCYYDAIEDPNPVQTDRTKPFAHALTGFVLRTFAAHPEYRKSAEARVAVKLMASRFFKPDKYSDAGRFHTGPSSSTPSGGQTSLRRSTHCHSWGSRPMMLM